MSSKAKKNEAQALIRYAREGDWKKAAQNCGEIF